MRAAGGPDGRAVDAEDAVRLALRGAGRVVRLTPAGIVGVPASLVTSRCFGGPHGVTLNITTVSEGLIPAAGGAEPYAGGLFRVDPGVPGLPLGDQRG